MKASEIAVGTVYSDGKSGLREVISIDPDARYSDERVTYRILSAKVEQEYSYAEKKMVSVIGTESQCNLASFSQWAKMRVVEVEALINELAARKLKLPPGEKAFMLSLGDEYMDCSIEFAFNETRQARGVEKKGLVTVNQPRAGGGGEVKLTELGIAWMRCNAKAAEAESQKE